MGSPISQPNIGIQLLPAAVVDAFDDRRDLVIGAVASGGAAVDGALNQNVHLLTNTELQALFGTGELYFRIQYFRSANGGYSPLDVIAITPTTGTQATATFVVSGGPAAADGSFELTILDGEQFNITVDFEEGDATTDVATAIDAALTAFSGTKPWTNGVATSTVTLTAVDGNEFPNLNAILIDGDTSAVTVEDIVVTPTQFSGGIFGNTLTSAMFNVISGVRYTGINWPEYLSSQFSLLGDELDSRFNVSSGIFDGVGFMGQSDDADTLTAAALLLNTQTLVMGGNDRVTTPVIPQPADWTMAYFQGTRARRLTPGAPISDFIVTTSGPLDASGGPALASLPYFNTPLALTPVTVATDQFTFTEQQTLEGGGVSYWGVNTSGNEMITGPFVTTWMTDSAGNENDSFKYLNYVDTGSACREVIYNTLKSVYAQSRLTEGDLIPGRSMANAASIKSELLRIYKRLADEALTQAGRAAESYFSTNTTVTVDLSTRSATIAGPLPIVTQLGVATYDLQLAFTVGQTGTQITF